MTRFVSDAETIVSILEKHAKHQPNKTAFTYLIDGERQQQSITYIQLVTQAKQFATQLLVKHQLGDRALLLFQPGLDYIRALIACFFAGITPIPAYPPGNKHYRHRLQSIAANAQAHMILSTNILVKKFDEFTTIISGAEQLPCHTYHPDKQTYGYKHRLPEIKPETIALLQYTSGSLSAPKGVLITHKNLLHNQKMIKEAFNHDEKTVFASWLPLFHDMGLIGNTLQPLFLGVHCVFMSAAKFKQSPIRWLKMIARFKATTSGAPNFAYQACVDNISNEQLSDLDLSHWKVAYCGSEPIRANTLKAFNKRFSAYGFKENTLYPCYGLAEASLFVSGKVAQTKTAILPVELDDFQQGKITVDKSKQNKTMSLVSCGKQWRDEHIIIVNPSTKVECADNTIGEIWLAGKHIANGYWKALPETVETFHAHTAIDNKGPYLRTGDMGFMHEDELYITGRLKELLIINGKNYYPQDIEQSIYECHALLADNGAATFIFDKANQQQLAIIAETKSRYISYRLNQDIIKRIKQTAYLHHNLVVQHVRLIQPGTLPRTTSGKLQRLVCREFFIKQKLTLTKIQQLQTNNTGASISHTD